MQIRKITAEDAGKFLKMLHQLDSETDMMMFEPGERNHSVEDIIEMIKRREKVNALTLGIFANDHIAGYLVAERGNANRVKHSFYLHLGILKNYQGEGLANKLLKYLIEFAQNHSVKRIELTVRVDNQKAVSLYQKFGFEIEGIKKCSLFTNNSYIDEYYMSKILD